jgi:hypothetical protein
MVGLSMKKTIVTTLLFGLYSLAIQAQEIGTGKSLNILNNENFEGFENLDSAILKARVVMTGENHTYVTFNSQMELKMLRYLNQKTGLRDFVIELGGARAHFLNRYISGADTMAEKYLKATTSPRYMDLFKRLKKFNMELPDSLRITVHGIDVERFNDLPVMRLSELLPDSAVPSALFTAVDAIEMASAHLLRSGLEDYETARDESGWGRYNYPAFYIGLTIYEFLDYYDSLEPQFQNWLGPKFKEVDDVVGWLREYKQWKDFENTTYQYIWREEGIYTNFSEILRQHPDQRFYGQFGRCHVAYEEQNGNCGWYGYHSVINKLKTRYFKGHDSILTLGIFYYGSPSGSYYSYGDREDDDKLQDEIDELIDNTERKTVTLFDLHDELAQMPMLAAKFSYAIVNNQYIEEEEDSIESEVYTADEVTTKEFEPYSYWGAGYTFSNINTDVLGNHVASNGISSTIRPMGFASLVVGTSDVIATEMRVNWYPTITLHKDGDGELRYGAITGNLKLGYQFLKKKHVQLNAGIDLAYGREKVSLINDSTSFLAARADKHFTHHSFNAGPTVQALFYFGEIFYFGVHASRLYDFTSNQWYYAGSRQQYGEAGKVSAGFSGVYYGISLGIAAPLYGGYEDYSYYDKKEVK